MKSDGMQGSLAATARGRGNLALTENKSILSERKRIYHLLLILLSGVCASIFMIWLTAHDLGVTPDSTIYIDTAKNLQSGRGFVTGGEPLTHYPPLYPALLAATAWLLSGDILQAGRALHAVLLGANVILIGFVIYLCTGHSLLVAGCSILLFLSSAPIILMHFMAWSEPLFFAFSLSTIVLLMLHVSRPSHILCLAASVSLGLALLTRYVGVTLLPPVAIGLILFGERPLRHKIADLLICGFVSSLILGIWLVRNVIVAGTATNRVLAYHPIGWQKTSLMFTSLYDLTLPFSISDQMKLLQIGIATGLFIIAGTVLLWRVLRRAKPDAENLLLPAFSTVFFAIFAVTYVAFMVLTISFLDGFTPDARRLSPVFVFWIIAASALVWGLTPSTEGRVVRWAFVVVVLFAAVSNFGPAYAQAIDINKNGRGYTADNWRYSDTATWVASYQGSKKIYTNGPDAILFLTEKTADWIPRFVHPNRQVANDAYMSQMSQMCAEFHNGDALIVIFTGITWRPYLPTVDEMRSYCNLPVPHEFQDGMVFGSDLEMDQL